MIDLRSATLSVDWTGSNKKEAIEEEIAHDLFKILTRVFIMTHHIKVEYYYADFHEQMVFHLEKEEQERVKQLFEQNDYSALRDFVEELEDERGCDADPWWYDEPFNLRMSIEVDGEIIESESSHASAFVNGDSMINAQLLCPTLRYLNRICDEAGEDPDDFNEGNEILMVTAGNDAGEQMLKGAEFWNDYADKCEKEILDSLGDEADFYDYLELNDCTPHMCLFDSFLRKYGLEEQLVLIESLEGEGERSIEFDIDDEFDLSKLKFIYDNIQNPDTHFADEQIMMDRVVYDNKLYGEYEFLRCHYTKDKFVLATINKNYPGWLHYIDEIVLKDE